MKKLLITAFLLASCAVYSQEAYFTIYNFTVEAEDVSTVYKLVDDYYSKNKPEGVTVYLYENHFNDSGNNHSHSIVFAGSLDAVSAMYGGGQNDTWQLFITRINQHLKDSSSSAMGTRIAGYGDRSASYPVQKYFFLDVEDGDAFEAGYRKYHSEHNPEGMIVAMGNITAGRSPAGENRWVLLGYKDFKSAMGGSNMLRNDEQKAASEKAWDEFMASHGGVEVVRSGLRILLGTW